MSFVCATLRIGKKQGITYGISDDSDGVPCCETGESATESCCEVDKAGVERVAVLRGQSSSNQDGHHQTVDAEKKTDAS